MEKFPKLNAHNKGAHCIRWNKIWQIIIFITEMRKWRLTCIIPMSRRHMLLSSQLTGGLQACFTVRQEHGIRSTALNNIFNHTVDLPSTLPHLKTIFQNKKQSCIWHTFTIINHVDQLTTKLLSDKKNKHTSSTV